MKFMPVHRRAGHGLFAASFMCLLVLSGCTGRFNVPRDYYATREASLMGDDRTREEGYRQVFRELPKIHQVGKLVAHNKLWPGKEHFHITFMASDASLMRLRGYRPPNLTVFDLTVENGAMTVLLEQTGGMYQGTIPEEGSPFRHHFGVEPWDLIPILTFGQLLAKSGLPLEEENLVKEQPGENLDGLVSYQLDKESGLPRSADWKWAKSRTHVEYQDWDYFTDAAPDRYRNNPQDPRAMYLMPAKLKISSPDISIRLDLKILEYHYDSPLTRESFIIYNTYQPTRFPLEQLEEAFKP
jgi:hypothetical protein